MLINDRSLEHQYSELKSRHGGSKQDYFGVLYLAREFGLTPEKAVTQVSIGNSPHGIDGFHVDAQRKNLYLFQFKYADSPTQFKTSLRKLIDTGMERVFGSEEAAGSQDRFLQQLKSALIENESVIERVLVHFVFLGDPDEAERSQVLDKLREDLESKQHLLKSYFDRDVSLVIEYRSAQGRAGATVHRKVSNVFTLHMVSPLLRHGPNAEAMHVGFVRLMDLHEMHAAMGQRFFDRNIRAALKGEGAVNRSILKAFKEVVIDQELHPSVFSFNHNGVTLYVENVEEEAGGFKIAEPRLLNGAQTISTLTRFLSEYADHPQVKRGGRRLEDLAVLCKVIHRASPEFVTSVTINNNRQNPVEPWNLHANDMIQLELQDKFRYELGMYYERQENAFANLSGEDLGEQGISEHKALELLRLAQTFLVSDGEIDKLSRMRDVFENDKLYANVFSQGRLKADPRKILLCYKIQFRLRKLMSVILEKGQNKYAYIGKARLLLWALLCQALLNEDNVDELAARFGTSLSIEVDYADLLVRLATNRCRFLIGDLVEDKAYATKVEEGNFSFLRTNAVFKKCMDAAHDRWQWSEKRLK
jgi:hypothetical protein